VPGILPPHLVCGGHEVVTRAQPDGPVDEFPDDVGVPGVPVSLGDHVDQDPVQTSPGGVLVATGRRGRPAGTGEDRPSSPLLSSWNASMVVSGLRHGDLLPGQSRSVEEETPAVGHNRLS
jgi:hypothetical protein